MVPRWVVNMNLYSNKYFFKGSMQKMQAYCFMISFGKLTTINVKYFRKLKHEKCMYEINTK